MRDPAGGCPLRPIPVAAAGLPPDGQEFALHVPPEEVGHLLAEAGWDEVGAAAALEGEVRVLPSGAELFVLGHLKTRMEYRCVRCLAPFEAPVDAPFRVSFTRVGAQPAGESPGERELCREDLEVEVLASGVLDVAAVVAEQLFLALESHPVCRPSCRGLCPQCGADRNQAVCRCSEQAGPRPFEALDAWSRARRG